MTSATLEHVNVTVSDADVIADLMCSLFDWHVRWQGDAINGGHTIHVGSDDSYVAVYANGPTSETGLSRYEQRGGLNHIGVVVDDLDGVERRVKEAGYATHNHADYEPGRRFYFNGPDGIEFEVVSYA
ncbi:MAG: VOC family protein [Hyphomicrobiaceae bacterium]